ncbi:MAG: 30S ribosomal protein S6e [Methanobrevibacter boviskoreani]|uniref:30S ribosomal protein S6e n=1 Tax=Methanobrevibacter TaxID=2172 RepID=UPI0003348362|nr:MULTISPECIES: 30S ribosomal protein S6e [Methanobrevibacter]AGN16607.1 ribosomal protein S6e Rps6e [Methanobrevibacter sp. AbM4]MCI6774759.1 30S ribosomal protein S6e [Methanobrevibacter boviskoreani]MCI6930562.1 30S ribosomal protein S6e [Methanobrevibacter boviskoreani]MDD6256729.1 30S ribosomal protein S6e [Methanobrevibacter boviskoreani]MDY5614697.1 30S ribosomal protein S6e [Methanobrevibacter boviskoreani]
MVFKVVVSDKDQTYQIETEETIFNGKKIGDDVDGSAIGLDGYNLKITGGSDKNGFAMRKDISGPRRIKTLVSGGVGYKPERAGEKRRKTMRGNTISDDIVQINTIVLSRGSKSLSDILGSDEEDEE